MALKKEPEIPVSGDPEADRVKARRFLIENGRTTDRFLRAWVMLKVASQESLSFLNKKRKAKELEGCMRDLCLLDFEPSEALTAEWQDFLKVWLHTCYESRTYRSTAFGLIPISDSALTEKIVNDINLITQSAPADFGREAEFLPLRKVAIQVFSDLLEGGETLRAQYFPGE